MGSAIVVTSGKGGTGKTTVTAGLASCLAALGKRVLAIDADIGLRNLDIVLGMSDCAVMDFHDAICGRCLPEEAVAKHPQMENLFLVAAPTSVLPKEICPLAFNGLVERLKAQYDFCFIDCAAGLDTAFQLAVGAADAAIVVTNTEAVGLRDAARVAALLEQRALRFVKLVVNRVRPYMVEEKDAADIDEAMDATGLPLLGIVPEDETVIACANHAVPIVLQGPTQAGRCLLSIARRLLGETVPIEKKIKVSASRFIKKI